MWTVGQNSLKSIRDNLRSSGVINPSTAEPPTISAIEKAAFKWAIEHPEEARKDLHFSWSRYGAVLTDEKWMEFLLRAAGLVYYQRPAHYERFIALHNLQQYT